MPLSFQSISHGEVAFGFFNIDSDMLLLNQYFFFADDFCRHISDLAKSENTDRYNASWKIHQIDNPRAVGDLMGAIHGTNYEGFIGDLYRLFPFPTMPQDFKQKPEGNKTREVVINLIRNYAVITEIQFVFDRHQHVQIGEYQFDKTSFYELVKYVWRGGYPRWKDEVRPDYVMGMKNSIDQNGSTSLVNAIDW